MSWSVLTHFPLHLQTHSRAAKQIRRVERMELRATSCWNSYKHTCWKKGVRYLKAAERSKVKMCLFPFLSSLWMLHSLISTCYPQRLLHTPCFSLSSSASSFLWFTLHMQMSNFFSVVQSSNHLHLPTYEKINLIQRERDNLAKRDACCRCGETFISSFSVYLPTLVLNNNLCDPHCLKILKQGPWKDSMVCASLLLCFEFWHLKTF